jgi:hypothetical protein
LEINVGYNPGGTLNRNLLDFSRVLDLWSIFGLPLWISIGIPSDTGDDPLARKKEAAVLGDWTPSTQRAWIARYLPIALVKPYVQGITWNQLADSTPHDFPHGGMFDAHGKAKPALRTLSLLRQAMLKE